MLNLAQKVRRTFRNQRGFTLVELLVVVAIIAILAAVLMPRLLGYTHQARVSRTQGDLASMRSIVEAWAANEGQGYYPKADNIADDGIAKALQGKGIAWATPDNPVKDPWGTPYEYQTAPNANNTVDQHCLIVSCGPNKARGDDDDIYCSDSASPTQGTPPAQSIDGQTWGTSVKSA